MVRWLPQMRVAELPYNEMGVPAGLDELGGTLRPPQSVLFCPGSLDQMCSLPDPSCGCWRGDLSHFETSF